MKSFSSLRCLDESARQIGNTSACLHVHGYSPLTGKALTGINYARFVATFDDATEISGYIDVASWVSQSLPKLEGMDWLSVDERILPALLSSCPLHLELVNQHAQMETCRFVEIVKNRSCLSGLPCVLTSHGHVLIEQFLPGSVAVHNGCTKFSNFPIPLAFQIGQSVLPGQALHSIEVGDVLLISHVARQVRTNNKTIFQFELNQESIMLLETSEREESEFLDENEHEIYADVSDEPPESNAPKGPAGIAALPVNLSFVLLEKTVTLAELQAMAPGTTVELPQEQVLNVEIRANRQKFARGELIQLSNGQLGVEIRTIWS